jgi:hypothetical protein
MEATSRRQIKRPFSNPRQAAEMAKRVAINAARCDVGYNGSEQCNFIDLTYSCQAKLWHKATGISAGSSKTCRRTCIAKPQQLFEFNGNAANYTRPITWSSLPEQPCGWIPGAILSDQVIAKTQVSACRLASCTMKHAGRFLDYRVNYYRRDTLPSLRHARIDSVMGTSFQGGTSRTF